MMRPDDLRSAPIAVALLIALSGCAPESDFDGRYRVASHTLNDGSCTEPGGETTPEFSRFEVREESWLGVTIYPVYPCDENGVCAEDNDAEWSFVTREEDLDQVSMTTAGSGADDSCVLSSVDLVIDRLDGVVVLQRRTFEFVVAPYDAETCTTDEAKAARGDMECVQLLQLVGVRETAIAI